MTGYYNVPCVSDRIAALEEVVSFFFFSSRRWVVSTNFGNRAIYSQQVEMVSLYGNAGIRKENEIKGEKKKTFHFFFFIPVSSLSLFVRELFYRLLSLSHTARHTVRV